MFRMFWNSQCSQAGYSMDSLITARFGTVFLIFAKSINIGEKIQPTSPKCVQSIISA